MRQANHCYREKSLEPLVSLRRLLGQKPGQYFTPAHINADLRAILDAEELDYLDLDRTPVRAPWVCLRVVEEREFLLIRNPLARFPATMRAIIIMLTAAELHRSVDTLKVRNFAKHR